MTITQNLADALRAVLPWVQVPDDLLKLSEQARAALAEYDRGAQLPTDFRVTWELDAFSAKTPEEAAHEASNVFHTQMFPVFVVTARDGSQTVIDTCPEDEG